MPRSESGDTPNVERELRRVFRKPRPGLRRDHARLPKEESPRRPTLTAERYDALLAKAGQVGAGFELLLVLAHETAHRVGAIRMLRWSDVDLDGKRLRWRSEDDNIGLEHETPLTDAVVGLLTRHRGRQKAIGDSWVCCSPNDPARPISRHLARDWWQRGAVLAKLPKGQRFGHRSLRRQFATEMKHTPLKDLAHLGGWKSPQTLLLCYQRPDEATQRVALAGRRKLTANGIS